MERVFDLCLISKHLKSESVSQFLKHPSLEDIFTFLSLGISDACSGWIKLDCMPDQPASLENSIQLFEQDGHLQAMDQSQAVQLVV